MNFKLALKYVLDPKFGSAVRWVLRMAVLFGARYGLQLNETELVAAYASFETFLQGLVALPIGNAPADIHQAAVDAQKAAEEAKVAEDAAQVKQDAPVVPVAPVVPIPMAPPPPAIVVQPKPVVVPQPVE